MNFTMTKEEALRIQADQLSWYNRDGTRPWLEAEIKAKTTASELEDGVEYPVHVINQHIPRGYEIEWAIQRREGR